MPSANTRSNFAHKLCLLCIGMVYMHAAHCFHVLHCIFSVAGNETVLDWWLRYIPIAGMRPFGLILRNQSSCCSFLDKEMGCTLHLMPSSSIKMLAFQPLGVPAVYRVMPFLSDMPLAAYVEPAFSSPLSA